MTPRVGIAGHGSWVRQYLLPGLRAAGADVVALTGRDLGRAEAAASDLGVATAFASIDKMIATSRLDAVVVAGPPATHRAHALAAIQAGLPVLCEKPLGLDAAETAELIAAPATAPALVGLTLRWHPTVKQARDLLANGAIGAVRYVDISYASAAGEAPTTEWDWHYDAHAEPAGVLSDLGPHAIDLVRWTTGDIRTVHATGRTTIPARLSPDGLPREVTNIDVADLQLELAGGAAAHILCSRVHPPTEHGAGVRLTALGDRGWLLLTLGTTNQLTVTDADGRPAQQTHTAEWHQMAERQMAEFLACVHGRSERSDLPTLHDGHAAQLVIDAALTSMRDRAAAVDVG